jgi:sterol desaturase/sphingolipid hydroxylase (fatty acid hydroxylase superfamily)
MTVDDSIGSTSADVGLRKLSGVEQILAVAGFPLAITLGIGVTIVAIGRGVDPNLMIAVVIPVTFLTLAIMERLFPWHRSWLHSHGDLRTDAGLGITNAVIGGTLGTALLVVTALAGAALAERVGIGLWPLEWPLLAQLALALVIAELVEYSWHRAMHEVPWLWRFHATHHSCPRLYWLNAARFHPIDTFVAGTIKLVPLALLGADLPVLALVNIFSAIHGAYQHANLPVRIGPLNWIFSMTELHRWHHSRSIEESNHNYGGNLIVWDVLLGTRWLPSDREPPEAIGMEALPAFPMGFWANLASPFRWSSVVEEANRPAPGDASR